PPPLRRRVPASHVRPHPHGDHDSRRHHRGLPHESRSVTSRLVEAAFFEPAGNGTFVATPATAGPWAPDAQHGGPPSALAAWVIEQHEPSATQRLARVAIDILRPVPLGKLTTRVRTVRAGRRIALLESTLEASGQEVLHARGWRIERPRGPVPVIPDQAAPAQQPGPSTPDAAAPNIPRLPRARTEG